MQRKMKLKNGAIVIINITAPTPAKTIPRETQYRAYANQGVYGPKGNTQNVQGTTLKGNTAQEAAQKIANENGAELLPE